MAAQNEIVRTRYINGGCVEREVMSRRDAMNYENMMTREKGFAPVVLGDGTLVLTKHNITERIIGLYGEQYW